MKIPVWVNLRRFRLHPRESVVGPLANEISAKTDMQVLNVGYQVNNGLLVKRVNTSASV